jgi:hypothetical protein
LPAPSPECAKTLSNQHIDHRQALAAHGIPLAISCRNQFAARMARMITLVNSTFDHLTTGQRQAVDALTIRRYIEDVSREADQLDAAGRCEGRRAFKVEFGSRCRPMAAALKHVEPNTRVVAVFAHRGDRLVALAAMRAVRGSRDTPVSQSVGDRCSSVPTHRLLGSFEYPTLGDFDPDAVPENAIIECCRLVAATPPQMERLVRGGFLSVAEARYVTAVGCSELIVDTYAAHAHGDPVAAYVFTIQPRLAHVLHARLGLNLLPLFGRGATPTEATMSRLPTAPYFARWMDELRRVAPDLMDREGPTAVLQHIAERVPARSIGCRISLPFLLVANEDLRSAIARLAFHIEGRRPVAA